MSPETSANRLVTFEIAGSLFALPISEVVEVVECANVAGVPRLSRASGGVMNWHGEALPVVEPHLLLAGESGEPRQQEVLRQYLVVARGEDEPACFCLPTDGVVGLVEGEPGLSRGSEVVVERRPVDGRVVNVINPRRLVARAVEVIEEAVA